MKQKIYYQKIQNPINMMEYQFMHKNIINSKDK